MHAIQQEKEQMANQLILQEQKKELDKQSLLSQHQTELAQKDELIAYYKDFKAKQSTKMIGESLEQHCEYEFNRLRMTAFPNAQFSKDNDAKTGSKGDYIYREFDENGIEIISIMFEMKNEADQTASKKKNEHFFKELDSFLFTLISFFQELESFLFYSDFLFSRIREFSFYSDFLFFKN